MKLILFFGVCIFFILILIFIHRKKTEQYKNIIESFGNKKMYDQLDLFTFSKFSANCCPSTYTSSLGCLCNDYYEHEMIASRGENRHKIPCR